MLTPTLTPSVDGPLGDNLLRFLQRLLSIDAASPKKDKKILYFKPQEVWMDPYQHNSCRSSTSSQYTTPVKRPITPYPPSWGKSLLWHWFSYKAESLSSVHTELLAMVMRKRVKNFSKDLVEYPFLAMPANANTNTKCQHQHCNKSAMTLPILFSFKSIESLEDGVAIHFQVTPLNSARIELSSLMAELSLTLSVNGPLGDNILRFLLTLIINRRCVSVAYLPHTSHWGRCQKGANRSAAKNHSEKQKTAHNLSKQLWNAEVTSSRCEECCDWLQYSMLWYHDCDWLKHFMLKGLFTPSERMRESEKGRNSFKQGEKL